MENEYSLTGLLEQKTLTEVAKMLSRTPSSVQYWRDSGNTYKIIKLPSGEYEVWEKKEKK